MRKQTEIKAVLREAVILFVITLLAGFLLGFVYELTKEPIERQQEKAIQEACTQVFEEADDFVVMEYTPSGKLLRSLSDQGIKTGKTFGANDGDGNRLGYVLEMTTTKGYGGNIVLYVGISLDRTVKGVSILEISETPGLGMRAEEVLVPQFHDKQIATFTYTKSGSSSDSEIDAISGATITTRAFVEAVNESLLVFDDLIKGGAR